VSAGPAGPPATAGIARRVPRLPVALAVAVMCAIWGSTWLVIREGLEEMQPLGSAGLRFLIAGAVMLVVAPRIARREGGERPPLRLVAVMGLGNFAISYGLVYWAEVVVPSGLTAILWGVFPLITAVVGHVYLPESRIRGRQWAGLVAGFLGVLLLFVTDLPAIGPESVRRGAILLLSPLSSALAVAYAKRHGASVSSALLNREAMLLGGALLTGAAFVFEGGIAAPASARAWFSVTYLALFGTVVTFSLYFWALRRASPTSLSLIAYVTPGIALLLGVGVGGESLSRWSVAGLALVVAGSVAVLAPRGARLGAR